MKRKAAVSDRSKVPTEAGAKKARSGEDEDTLLILTIVKEDAFIVNKPHFTGITQEEVNDASPSVSTFPILFSKIPNDPDRTRHWLAKSLGNVIRDDDEFILYTSEEPDIEECMNKVRSKEDDAEAEDDDEGEAAFLKHVRESVANLLANETSDPKIVRFIETMNGLHERHQLERYEGRDKPKIGRVFVIRIRIREIMYNQLLG